jgi:hypothetical protein
MGDEEAFSFLFSPSFFPYHFVNFFELPACPKDFVIALQSRI